MSYCYFHGIMPVSDGRKVQTVRGNGSIAWHVVYDTICVLDSGSDIEGILRAYSPPSASIIPSDTLVMVHGKYAMVPSTDRKEPMQFVVDSIKSVPFSADPKVEGFDSFLPEDSNPVISLLGTVVGSLVHLDDGKAVDVKVSTYVQNKNVESIYRCRFPHSPRWARVNMPIAGSVISVLGRPHSITGNDATGLLMITVEDITYNPGAANVVDESRLDPATGSGRKLQVKKRRRTALDAGSSSNNDASVNVGLEQSFPRASSAVDFNNHPVHPLNTIMAEASNIGSNAALKHHGQIGNFINPGMNAGMDPGLNMGLMGIGMDASCIPSLPSNSMPHNIMNGVSGDVQGNVVSGFTPGPIMGGMHGSPQWNMSHPVSGSNSNNGASEVPWTLPNNYVSGASQTTLPSPVSDTTALDNVLDKPFSPNPSLLIPEGNEFDALAGAPQITGSSNSGSDVMSAKKRTRSGKAATRQSKASNLRKGTQQPGETDDEIAEFEDVGRPVDSVVGLNNKFAVAA